MILVSAGREGTIETAPSVSEFGGENERRKERERDALSV